jgi:hypothetical protein
MSLKILLLLSIPACASMQGPEPCAVAVCEACAGLVACVDVEEIDVCECD